MGEGTSLLPAATLSSPAAWQPPSLRHHAAALYCKSISLTNCHACDREISPMFLEILDSLWRIVILCPNCLVDVHSSKICSYCFEEILAQESLGETISCTLCAHRIHRRCVSCLVGNPFTCVDCWVPRALSRRISPASEILLVGSGGRSLEELVHDAELNAKKAAEMAARARRKARRKALAAKCAAHLAQSALGLIDSGYKLEDQPKSSPISCAKDRPFVDDKEFALRLHRAINCSRFRRTRGMHLQQLPVIQKCQIEEGRFDLNDNRRIGAFDGGLLRSSEAMISLVDDKKGRSSSSHWQMKIEQNSNPAKCKLPPCRSNAERSCSVLHIGDFYYHDRYLKKYVRRKQPKPNIVLNGESAGHQVYFRKCCRRSADEISTSESGISPSKKLSSHESCNEERGTYSDGSSKSVVLCLPASGRANGLLQQEC